MFSKNPRINLKNPRINFGQDAVYPGIFEKSPDISGEKKHWCPPTHTGRSWGIKNSPNEPVLNTGFPDHRPKKPPAHWKIPKNHRPKNRKTPVHFCHFVCKKYRPIFCHFLHVVALFSWNITLWLSVDVLNKFCVYMHQVKFKYHHYYSRNVLLEEYNEIRIF